MLLFPEAVGQIYNGQQTLVTLHLPSFRTSLGQRELHTQSKLDNFYFRKQKSNIVIDTFLFHRSFEMPEKLIISPEVDQIRIDPKGVELRES